MGSMDASKLTSCQAVKKLIIQKQALGQQGIIDITVDVGIVIWLVST